MKLKGNNLRVREKSKYYVIVPYNNCRAVPEYAKYTIVTVLALLLMKPHGVGCQCLCGCEVNSEIKQL